MSVRATERLIGDLVHTPGLPHGPKMIVQSVDIEAKLVTTVWFTDGQEYQEGVFPSSGLDRVDPAEAEEEPPKKAEPETRGRGRAPKK